MSRTYPLALVCAGGLVLSGCGPMRAPLPERLDDEQQKAVNESWDKALAPVGRFGNQALLDVLMTSCAYQYGVDKLDFRSEKSFAGGRVVMEVQFDRLEPERDLFSVTVQDRQGNVLRRENYKREQIENTYRELFVEPEAIRRKKEQGVATPEEVRKLEGWEARWAVVNGAFPKPVARDEKPNAPAPNK